MTNTELKIQETTKQEQSITDYIHFIKWTVVCSRKELIELNDYIHEKIRDLVTKFRAVAENAAAKISGETQDDERERLNINGKDYSYAEATKEMHRLTDTLLSNAKLTSDRVVARKQLDNLALALFNHAKKKEMSGENVIDSGTADKITGYIKEIIISFQFQDFVTQRLTHIDLIFETLEQETDKMIAAHGDGEVPDAMAQNLLDKFFLSNVKQFFIDGLDPAKAQKLNVTIEADDEDDIELF